MVSISGVAPWARCIPVVAVVLAGISFARAQSDSPAQNPARPSADPQALWSTPGDGRLVMLLRNTTDQRVIEEPAFITPVPFRVRVCVTNFAGTSNAMNLFVWTTDGPGPNGKASSIQPQVLHPGLGDCVEIDRPAAITVQDSTTSGSASGYYQLLQAIALPEKSGVMRSTPPDIVIGQPDSKEVACTALQPNDRTKFASPDFAKACQLDVTAPRNQVGVRICTGDNFVKFDGAMIDYPAGYLELTATDLRGVPKNSSYNPYWNPISPASCRDVIWQPAVDKPMLHSLFFMVGPAQPVPVWDPAKVASISITTQAIMLNAH